MTTYLVGDAKNYSTLREDTLRLMDIIFTKTLKVTEKSIELFHLVFEDNPSLWKTISADFVDLIPGNRKDPKTLHFGHLVVYFARRLYEEVESGCSVHLLQKCIYFGILNFANYFRHEIN